MRERETKRRSRLIALAVLVPLAVAAWVGRWIGQQSRIQRNIAVIIDQLDDPDKFTRQGAAGSLAQMGPAAFKPLVEVLNSGNATSRASAAGALAQMKDSRVVPILIKALHSDQAEVRRIAAEGLGRKKAREAVQPLIQAWKSDPNFAEALRALGNIGDKAASSVILQALGSSSPAAEAACTSAAQLGVTEARGPLHQLLNDPQLRLSAATALAQLGDQAGLGILIKALTHKEERVRNQAMQKIAQLGPGAARWIVPLLKDERVAVRGAAASMLQEIGGPEAVEPLIKALQDRDPKIRHAAAGALGKNPDPRAIEPLMALWSDKNELVRQAAHFALSQCQPVMTPEHTAAIIQRLQNNNALVRAGAANALGLIRCREAVDPLMERLSQDQEASVRQSAANALGRIGEKRAEAALVKAQSDPSKEVQSAAKMSLALLRSGNLK